MLAYKYGNTCNRWTIVSWYKLKHQEPAITSHALLNAPHATMKLLQNKSGDHDESDKAEDTPNTSSCLPMYGEFPGYQEESLNPERWK